MKTPSWLKRPSGLKRPLWLKPKDWRPTTWIAIGLVVLAGISLVLWFTARPGVRAWVPNITVGAVTVAATITIIDRTVRREAELAEKRRRQPRVESALSALGLSFAKFMSNVVSDYAATHIDTFKDVPSDDADQINLWLSEQGNTDGEREHFGQAFSQVIVEGLALADTFERHRERGRDVLEPDLIAAMDTYCTRVAWHTATIKISRGHWGASRP